MGETSGFAEDRALCPIPALMNDFPPFDNRVDKIGAKPVAELVVIRDRQDQQVGLFAGF